MLFQFARLLRGPPRAPLVEEPSRDAPPEGFVEKVSDEGGDVYIAPMLDALRASLRAKRAPDASVDEPEAGTQAAGTEAP